MQCCSVCAKPESEVTGKLLLCSKCKITAYCSKKCQRSDAKAHKKVCGLQNKGIGSQASKCCTVELLEMIQEVLLLWRKGWEHGARVQDCTNDVSVVVCLFMLLLLLLWHCTIFDCET